ncbi:MAG: preprotein translocase subunit YajC [Clostridia bacterium]|nr:preprotein translocase subunit YajC [Clostridia bacterium]
MLLNLLTSEAGNNNANDGGWVIWVVFAVAIVVMIVMNHFSNKKRKAQMEAEKEKRNSIQPGFKIVTIGGIVGTVAEVDDDANTFVLKTGTEENPSYLTFDKVAIYTSEDPNAPTETEEQPAEEPADETPIEEQSSTAGEDADNTQVEETVSVEETEEKAE